MISIVIEKSSGICRSFSCVGHAGFAESGKDIVCAAASVLVINTVNAIDQLTDTPIEVSTDRDSGRIVARFPRDPDEKAGVLLEAMEMGLQEICNQYGRRYISFQVKEVQLC
ncbi:MAG: ribosomal-processing cysteine protease Prp [Lachnospiraceae bacterium]|nr:ribosomal-processing cysteine protease Prp [Lachnospiraceae bacterium]